MDFKYNCELKEKPGHVLTCRTVTPAEYRLRFTSTFFSRNLRQCLVCDKTLGCVLKAHERLLIVPVRPIRRT